MGLKLHGNPSDDDSLLYDSLQTVTVYVGRREETKEKKKVQPTGDIEAGRASGMAQGPPAYGPSAIPDVEMVDVFKKVADLEKPVLAQDEISKSRNLSLYVKTLLTS